MDYKDKTRAYYEHRGADFGFDKPDYHNFTSRFLREDFGHFLHELQGSLVLDLGSGPGRDAFFFKRKGLLPVCVDISPAAIQFCKKADLQACVAEGEHLPFLDGSFDGVWACGFLNHFPNDSVLPVAAEINRVLKRKGVLFANVGEGYHQGYLYDVWEEIRGPFLARHFDKDFREIISPYFEVVHFSRTLSEDGQTNELNYVCVKK